MRLPSQRGELNARVRVGGGFRRATAGVTPSAGEAWEMPADAWVDYGLFGKIPDLCDKNERFCAGTGTNNRLYVCCPKNWTCATSNQGRPYCRTIGPVDTQLKRNTPNWMGGGVWNQLLSYIS